MSEREIPCPDCAPDPGRRRFLVTAGAAAIAATTGLGKALAEPLPKGTKVGPAEASAKRFYESLTTEQRAVMALPATDAKVQHVGANWHIVPNKIGEFFNPEQQRTIHEIVRGATSEEGYERLIRQMQDDDGGIEKYSCATFGEPGKGTFQWLLTGRHVTLRVEGNTIPGVVFGGPMVYGHGAAGNKKENLFHYQTEAANEVFQALDGKQREKALLPMSPAEDKIQLKAGDYAGIAAGELSPDQRRLVEKVMHTLLAPYREADVKEAMQSVKANGGIEKIHLSFYKNEDLGSDQEWDIWRLESPNLVWHFRGSPHVHTWVNFRTAPGG